MAQPQNPIPYGTYGMLKSTIERFKEATVPTNLNRHVLHDLSGGDFSALSTTLRFLGLINEDRTVTQQFRNLVAAMKKSSTDYEVLLLEVLAHAYEPVVGDDFDMEAGTLPDLEKKFKEAGVPAGQMVTKAVRFYVKALEDCGVAVSEHITKPRPSRSPKPKNGKPKKPSKAKSKSSGGQSDPSGERETPLPQGFDRLPIPGMDGAFIQYPKNLTEGDCTMFEAMVTVLRTYVKSRKGEGKKP